MASTMTSTANNLTSVDADGDKCTANDGSWLCSTFDSWSSYESYLELNNAISIGKQESLIDDSSQTRKKQFVLKISC